MEHGFEFDTGVHYLGHDFTVPTEPLYRMWQLVTDGRVQLAPLDDDYDRVCVGSNKPFGFCSSASPVGCAWLQARPASQQPHMRPPLPPAGKSRLRERLVQAFPKEKRVIDRYMALCSYLSFLPAGAFFVTKLLPRWVGTLLAPLVHVLFHRWSDRTVTQVRLAMPERGAAVPASGVGPGSARAGMVITSTPCMHAVCVPCGITGNANVNDGRLQVYDAMTDNKELKALLAYKFGDGGLPPGACGAAAAEWRLLVTLCMVMAVPVYREDELCHGRTAVSPLPRWRVLPGTLPA